MTVARTGSPAETIRRYAVRARSSHSGQGTIDAAIRSGRSRVTMTFARRRRASGARRGRRKPFDESKYGPVGGRLHRRDGGGESDRQGHRRLSGRGAAVPRRDGRRLQRRGRGRPAGCAEAALARPSRRRAIPAALPARVAARCEARPPERGEDDRVGRGRWRALPRDGLRRRGRSARAPASRRSARARARRRAGGTGGGGARRGARGRARASGREARQRAGCIRARRRAGVCLRLRHRPSCRARSAA